MKPVLRNSLDRIHKQDTWKKRAYAFVPYQTNFGELCGFAEIVSGGMPIPGIMITTLFYIGTMLRKPSLSGLNL